MGLFDFVKEAGEKIWDAFSGDDKKSQAEKLKEHINKLQIPDADKVDIHVADDSTVTVSGDIPSQEAKEKIMVAVGNVEGISKVNDKITVAQGGEESRYYTVKSGDTLSAISQEVYGTANEYQRIFEANKPMLKSPEKIYPGQVLIIPKK